MPKHRLQCLHSLVNDYASEWHVPTNQLIINQFLLSTALDAVLLGYDWFPLGACLCCRHTASIVVPSFITLLLRLSAPNLRQVALTTP